MVMAMHYLLFGVPFEMHLSSTIQIEPWRLVAIPCLGGLVYGIVAYLIWRWRPRDIVDAIEANALHGGHMSLSGSMRLTALTILSGGVGASVGLEAYALRRYYRELEARHREELGDDELFSSIGGAGD